MGSEFWELEAEVDGPGRGNGIGYKMSRRDVPAAMCKVQYAGLIVPSFSSLLLLFPDLVAIKKKNKKNDGYSRRQPSWLASKNETGSAMP